MFQLTISIKAMSYLIHIANILYLISYLVKDIFLLRLVTIAGALCLLPYYYFLPGE